MMNKKYDYEGSFNEELATVGINGRYGFIDKEGKEIIELKYDWIDDFHEGLAAVGLDNKYKFIDKRGI